MCCDSYRGRLRTIKVFWLVDGEALGHNSCCDGLRTTGVLWWQQGLDEDNKDGFCGHWDRLMTNTLMCWLYG